MPHLDSLSISAVTPMISKSNIYTLALTIFSPAPEREAIHFFVQRQTQPETYCVITYAACDMAEEKSSWRQQSEHPCMVMVWLMLCGGRDVS